MAATGRLRVSDSVTLNVNPCTLWPVYTVRRSGGAWCVVDLSGRVVFTPGYVPDGDERAACMRWIHSNA